MVLPKTVEKIIVEWRRYVNSDVVTNTMREIVINGGGGKVKAIADKYHLYLREF